MAKGTVMCMDAILFLRLFMLRILCRKEHSWELDLPLASVHLTPPPYYQPTSSNAEHNIYTNKYTDYVLDCLQHVSPRYKISNDMSYHHKILNFMVFFQERSDVLFCHVIQ